MNVLRHSGAALSAVVGVPLLLGAAALSPRWRTGLGERLGAGPRATGHPLWVHAASVGEILAASRLVDALQSKGHAVVTSTSTTTGREVMSRARPNVSCRLAPLDHPWCVSAALARVAPRALASYVFDAFAIGRASGRVRGKRGV